MKEKTYNKQRIYVVNQDILKDLGKGNVGEIDSKISGLDSEYKATLEDLKKYEVELKAIHKVISTSEAKKQLLEVRYCLSSSSSIFTSTCLGSLHQQCCHYWP